MNTKEISTGAVALVIIIGGFLYFAKPKAPEVIKKAPICTQDVKQCSDGSYVNRISPTCEFAICPRPQSTKVMPPVITTKVITIKYSSAGFDPVNIKIAKGTKVEFANNSNMSFWPASDPHPTHTIYPEFDAKTEIAPGNKFVFTFNKVGTWKYHNHLDPTNEGQIEVK